MIGRVTSVLDGTGLIVRACGNKAKVYNFAM